MRLLAGRWRGRRGENVHPVRLDIDPQLIGQTTDIAQFFMPFKNLTQPGNLLFVMIGTGFDVGAFVTPVRANAQFSLFVHGVGADLHFQHLAFGPDDGGMQRAIAVFLGVGDVVVELLGNMPPQGMHDAQRGVAIAHFRDQHAQRTHVVDLTERQTFALHFAPDGIDVFGSAADVSGDAGGLQFVVELRHDLADETLAIQPALVQQFGDLLVLVRLQVAERQVFQLPLDVADAQAVGQRRIDVEDFPRHPVTLLRRRRRHQHLAQVFDLRLAAQHQRLSRSLATVEPKRCSTSGNGMTPSRTPR